MFAVDLEHCFTAEAKTQLLQEIVAAFKVEGVSPGSLPQSELSERRLLDELYDILQGTELEGLADIVENIYLIKGSLWILVRTESTLSKQQLSELQQSLKKVVKTLKRTAPLFAFAKEPKRIPLHAVPSRILNLAALARHISRRKKPQAFDRTSSEMSKGTTPEEGTTQEGTMPKRTSKLTPKCLAVKASALLAEMKAIFPDRHLRILEHGVEKTQGWLSGTEELHIVAEKGMAELQWKNAALREDINAIYKSISPARCEWSEHDRQIFTAVLFLIKEKMDESNQHKFYPIKQELEMVPFLHGECKSLCEPRKLLQKTIRFVCPDGIERGSKHLVVSMCLGLLQLGNFCIVQGAVLKATWTPKLMSGRRISDISGHTACSVET